jgi:hypothetical protein
MVEITTKKTSVKIKTIGAKPITSSSLYSGITPYSTGGMTTISGKPVLVTPSGTIVGSAAQPSQLKTITTPTTTKGGYNKTTISTPTTTSIPSSTIIPTKNITSTISEMNKISMPTQLPQQKYYGAESIIAVPKPKDFGEKISRQISKLEYQKQFNEKKEIIKPLEQTGIILGLGIISGSYKILRHPIETTKEITSLVYNLLTKPSKTIQNILYEAEISPIKFTGERIGETIIIGGITKYTPKYTREIYVRAGSEYIKPETILSKQVLKEGKPFPMTSSPEQSLKIFQQSKIVTHASPSPLISTIIKAGSAGKRLKEDPGLYVTPSKETSPHFLKVSEEVSPEYEVKLFPTFKRPTITEIEIKGVKRQPEIILKQSGFKSTAKFLSSQAGKGIVYITKRSEAAFRDLGVTGTKEMEGILPVGTTLKQKRYLDFSVAKLKGFSKYTSYKGYAVPIIEKKIGQEIDLSKSLKQFEKIKKSSIEEYSRKATTKEMPISSYLLSHKPSITPSYKPSITPSYKPSITPSYKPSITPSYKPSITPSYKPSITPSYKPSITPSYKPSITPSYKPSITPSYKPSITLKQSKQFKTTSLKSIYKPSLVGLKVGKFIFKPPKIAGVGLRLPIKSGRKKYVSSRTTTGIPTRSELFTI